MLGTGKIATMVLGSWSIVQMQAAAEAQANRDDIGYMPFPNQVNGKFHSVVGGDYKNGININSKNKATARAWIDWFANESGLRRADQGGVSPLVDRRAVPATLEDLHGGQVGVHRAEPGAEGRGGAGRRTSTTRPRSRCSTASTASGSSTRPAARRRRRRSRSSPT